MKIKRKVTGNVDKPQELINLQIEAANRAPLILKIENDSLITFITIGEAGDCLISA